ncbi:unnamed protein product [Caenorhabditis nigoni]
MTGIKEKQKSMNFDDDAAKESSDAVLMTLFSGNFSESQKSEIELKDIDPNDFQDFLEILYGEPSIDDDNCFGILKLADFFDAKTVTKRCEDFLLNLSEKPLKEKFEAATQYKLEELTKMCIFGMKTLDEIRSVMPDDATKIDHWAWKKLVEKSMTFS